MDARIAAAIVLLLAVPGQLASQTGAVLKFTNGQERAVVANVDKDITAIDIQEREFEGTVLSIGRANTLGGKLLAKLKTKDRKLYDEVRKITTSVEVTQGSHRFYVRGLKSTKLAGFRSGKPKVRCRVYLLEIRSGDEVSYLPIVAAIRKADEKASGTTPSSRRMADGKQWTTENLTINAAPSFCYEDAELNCRRYGRLYTWESAQQACRAVGDGWRLPTNDDWKQMAKHYGGVRDDSDDSGKAAYTALVLGGSSGFDAVLGGGRSHHGEYTRLKAHGFYWTASENDPATAWFYNFGQGGRALNRHKDGEKQRAFAVRCVRG